MMEYPLSLFNGWSFRLIFVYNGEAMTKLVCETKQKCPVKKRIFAILFDRDGNSGDPTGLYLLEKYGVQAIKSKETKCRCREADSSVVPMKLGNADGGKASYQLLPLLVTNLLHTKVENKWRQS